MKWTLYPKLAVSSIRKNRRFYLPYLLTCVGMVMMLYIIHYLAAMPLLDSMAGGSETKIMLGMGTYIVALFALIFLFYTNTFLMRRRKKEFGLYNILGMSKGNLGLVLLCETMIVGAISLAAGLGGGIALSKLAELVLTRVLYGQASYGLLVCVEALWDCLVYFAIIFALIFLNGLRQIFRANAVSLLRSESAGEKPPKANYLVGFGGAVVLAAAYYIAVTIQSPLSALAWFLIAVAMVIVATYALFISGSVVLCKLLKKNPRYYYQKNHFVSVSSMAYRMKRNGAGLASVCILSTMVLVMMVGVSCLYFGAEDSLLTRYPKDINLSVYLNSTEGLREENLSYLEEKLDAVIAAYEAKPENLERYSTVGLTGSLAGGYLETDSNTVNQFDITAYNDVCQVYFVSLEDYNRCMGASETLEPGQAMILCVRRSYQEPTINVSGCYTLQIVKQLDSIMGDGNAAVDVLPSVYLVVPDLQAAMDPLNQLETFSGDFTLRPRWHYSFDTELPDQAEIALAGALKEQLRDMNIHETGEVYGYTVESREANRTDFYGTYGGLFFLGSILTVVFVFATVLIIYYKQITEGYEDEARFEIMQKVGMTKADIRKSVNSQMLTVFFLPLATAVVHLGFAFPLLQKLLMLFNLRNLTLLLAVTAVTVIVFAVFYVLVYAITARTYYKIVSG